ncbi:YhjD/YihY/BrkB family envelope integrity protein [Clostridium sp.]|uniref:YhjD/YihY/BrkB family envelope integrity protein n=1 Tax=Clostridium sp. TaxID=1506 RepID=UPI001A3A5E39|nr:YhjD/YihY/BrkB family envelope integrity protein [Clostridium sp.]MBK5237378.1 YihY/virulence factor BrkB family protein [Clostridium sp.]
MIGKLRTSILFKYIKLLIFRYKDDDLSSMSAQITYYLIISFFHFSFFLINLVSFTPLSNEMLFTSFNMFLPDETGNLLKNMAVQTLQNKSKTLLLLGMIGSQL